MDTCYIYALSDPRYPGSYRYIGRAKDLRLRFNSHVCDGINDGKVKWIEQLSKIGLFPTVTVLETCTTDQSYGREAYWIKRYKGPDLLNQSFPTGDGYTDGNSSLPRRTRTTGPLSLSELEARYIYAILRRCSWNKQTAANILGIGRQTLYNKIREHDLRTDLKPHRPISLIQSKPQMAIAAS